MMLKGRFVGALAALLLAWFGLASMMDLSVGYMVGVALLAAIAMIGGQATLVFSKQLAESRLSQSILERYPDWKLDQAVSLSERISRMSQWSEWWYLEFLNASQRLEKFYARNFNAKVSDLAQEALWLEFELAKNSLMESVFAQGLELAKFRTRDIGCWLKSYNKPLSQEEIDTILLRFFKASEPI